MLMSMTAWLERLRQETHFCPHCSGVLQFELTHVEQDGKAHEALDVRCPGCHAQLYLRDEEVEAAATAQLLVHLGLRPQRMYRVGGHGEWGKGGRA